jgi:hypothetical protein
MSIARKMIDTSMRLGVDVPCTLLAILQFGSVQFRLPWRRLSLLFDGLNPGCVLCRFREVWRLSRCLFSLPLNPRWNVPTPDRCICSQSHIKPCLNINPSNFLLHADTFVVSLSNFIQSKGRIARRMCIMEMPSQTLAPRRQSSRIRKTSII